VPVTVTVNVLGDGREAQLTVSVEVPDAPGILVALSEAVHPAGATVATRVTVPVKPATGATVIVDVAEEPALKLIDAGLAVMVKSPPRETWTVTECDSAFGLVPATVTVKLLTPGSVAQATLSVEV